MPYIVFFPGHRDDFGDYTCPEMNDVRKAVYEEAEKTITNLGSDAYDPTDMFESLRKAHPDESEETLWADATHRSVTEAAVKLTDDIMARFSIEPPEDDPVTTYKLPDGHTIAITYEEDY